MASSSNLANAQISPNRFPNSLGFQLFQIDPNTSTQFRFGIQRVQIVVTYEYPTSLYTICVRYCMWRGAEGLLFSKFDRISIKIRSKQNTYHIKRRSKRKIKILQVLDQKKGLAQVKGGSPDTTCTIFDMLQSLKRAFRNGATLRVRSAVVTFPIEPKIRDRERSGSHFSLPEALRGAGPGEFTY